MKTFLTLCATLCFTTLILSGCNTVSGFGRDVQKAGQVVTGAGGK